MHAKPSYPLRKQKAVCCRRTMLRSAFVAFLLASLFLLITPGPSGVQAASFSREHGPHHWTPAQIRAVQQALKKQIRVTHTGRPRPPVTARVSRPLRPRQSDLPPYNNIGISDAGTRSGANFDGGGRSYSAQALQDVGLYQGVNVTSQNITFIWPSVATGQPDNYQAAGQIIPVTAPVGVTTVGFLGASTNKSSSGLASLNYQNCQSTSFTLGLTDWWSNTIQFNNQQVAAMTTIDTKHGTRQGSYYLYSATTAVNPNCTLTSVTLPATTSPGQLHIFAIGVGGPNYNNTGTSDDSDPSEANFDGSGKSYSAEALQNADVVPGQQFDSDGIAYAWPNEASGTANNFEASGQVLPVVPVPNATTLGILGAASGGDTSGTATLTFTDNSIQTFTLGFTDWTMDDGQEHQVNFGNGIATTMPYSNTPSGPQPYTTYLFTAEVTLPQGKTLQSVTLPTSVNGGAIHVFAVGTRAALNNLGSSNDSQPGEGNYDNAGRSWSIPALEAAGIQQGQPFIFNGVTFTWPASYGTLADNDVADGQTIPVTPVQGATYLAFLGSGTNGSPTGQAIINFTDNTTQKFPLNMTDWWSCSPQNGDLVAATFSTINQPGGPRSGTYCLYYFEVAINAGETVQSVTLPTTVSPTTSQMHIFAIGTRSDDNNIGISDDSNPSSANFDGGGNSYSAQDFADAGWNPGDTLTYEGINYVWPDVASGQDDNYQADGQVIPVTAPAGATTLGLVGAATSAHPSASGTVKLTYTDGTSTTFTLSFADWAMDDTTGTIIPPASNHLFALLPHYNNASGTHADNRYLFEVETPLDQNKQLQSVTLPTTVSGGNLNVFMLGTRTGENYPNNVGTSDDGNTVFANFDTAGRSYSIEALEAAELYEGQPFTFNGVTFTWPASYSVIPDNYQAAGQLLPVTPVSGATTLAFLGAATNAGSSDYTTGTATITYTDTSTQTFPLALTDWWNPAPLQGNQTVATCSYLNTQTGIQNQTVNLYYTDVALEAGKTIQSVTLPSTVSSGQMHVFALGTK